MARRTNTLLLALGLLLALPATLRAEEDPSAGELVTRVFHVGALTFGRPEFLRSRAGTVGSNEVADEDSPLFGAEGEEPLYPLGEVDELIELIKINVEPVAWEVTEGADIARLSERAILVRAPKDVVQRVAEYLAGLERELMRTVVLEIATVALTPDEVRTLRASGKGLVVDAGFVAPLLAGPKAGPSISLSAFSGGRVAAYRGQQRSYIQDYDVEVAQEATISDPIVSVANLGLSVGVRATLGQDPTRILVNLQATLALLLEEGRTADAGRGREIEVPDVDLMDVRSQVHVPSGAWVLLDGRAGRGERPGWHMLMRATAELPSLSVVPAGEGLLGSNVRADRGALESMSLDVQDLDQAVHHAMAREVNLVPSNFTPPEPPELAEPTPVFGTEMLVELIRASVAPRSWDRGGAMIDLRLGRLFLRNTPQVLRAVSDLVERVRAEFLETTVVEARLLDLERTPEVLQAVGGAGPLGPDALSVLEAQLADGRGTVLDAARVTSLSGARNAVEAGRRFAYLQDYEVEIAEASDIANPVVQEAFAGVVADVWPVRTTAGDAVCLTVRFTHSRLAGLVDGPTPHGPIQLPRLDLSRTQTCLHAPVGRPVLVATSSLGSRLQVLLLEVER